MLDTSVSKQTPGNRTNALPLGRRAAGVRGRATLTPSPTTEVATFFGPSGSPLFGVVHLPADRQIRGGVLVCGSLGKEGMDSVRLHRILAEDLSRRGLAVLLFDYLGLGGSAYAQGRDEAVTDWVTSVGHGLDYLRLIGAQSAIAVGIRAGCLILDHYLARTGSVDRVVYLDPPGTGRRYLREHTALYRLSVGHDAVTPGEVAIMGGRFSEHAATAFAALHMRTDPVGADGNDDPKVLLVRRPGETDNCITVLASAAGVDSITAPGLPGCARPRDVLTPIPHTAVNAIVEWVDRNVPTRTHRAVPRYLTTVKMPADGPDGVDVVERIERIEPNGVLAIRTLPRNPGPAATKTVLFFVTAYDLHVGPAREWVELSRRVAAAGSQALRWDPAGLGWSGQVRRHPWRRVYSKADIVDSVAVAEYASRGAGDLEVVGICSGSWYAAQAARKIGARSAILVNLLVWNWRMTPTVLSQWDVRKKTLLANTADDTHGGRYESVTRRLKALLDPARHAAKNLLHQHLPRYGLRVLSWIGLVHLPGSILTTLARRGTGVTLIASPEDAEQFTARGGRQALDRLHRASRPPRLITPPTGDHAAHHPALLAAIREAVLPVAVAQRQERSLA